MTGLAVQVRTRSKVRDYRFVGDGQQPERWWETNYGRWTDFARPTILVEPGKFFVSGIGSTRTDSKGARIHYALHVRVAPEGSTLAAQVLAWICDVLQHTGSLDDVGKYFDTLGEDVWSKAVQGEAEGIEATVTALLRDTPLLQENDRAPQPFLREGDRLDAFSMLAAMAAMVVALDPGRAERAVFLNLASSSELGPPLQQGRDAIVCRKVDTRPKTWRPSLAGAAVVLVGLVLGAVLFFNAVF